MYDFLVIGAGSGGVRFARLMGAKGFKVGIVEGDEIGGTCVLNGCIPKKLFIYASSFIKDINLSKYYGWRGKLQDFNLWQFMNYKNKELKRLNNIYTNILNTNNVEIIKGTASFISNKSIVVNRKEYKAKNFLVATGSTPQILEVPGFNLTLNSSEFLNLQVLPKTVVILGGGYIAVEFANILLALGIKVYMWVRSGKPLRIFDNSVSTFIKEQLELQGTTFINGTTLVSIAKQTTGELLTTFSNQKKIAADIVINAVGRVPNIGKLNLEKAGVASSSDGAIMVNDYFMTNIPNIYAIGDVINRVNLTPVATKQAMYLASNLVSSNQKPFDYNFIPKAVFCYPEVASCGLTETEAVEKGYEVDIYQSNFRPLKMVLTDSYIKSLFKIVVDKKSEKVLGIHIVDINAAEIMQGFAVALKHGITKSELDEVIGIHPTSAEELVTMYTKTIG